jgi:hypothetical protein
MPQSDFNKFKKFMDGSVFYRETSDGFIEVKQVAPNKQVSKIIFMYLKANKNG